MTEQKFCPRCAKPGVKAEIGGDLIWTCPDHGMIWKEAAPATAAAKPAPAKKATPRKLN